MTQVAVWHPAGRKWNMEPVRIIRCAFDPTGPVVAISADTGNRAGMIAGSKPGDCILVANIAIGGRGDMPRALPLSDSTIVATHAYTGWSGSVVYKLGGQPGTIVMAFVAIIAGHTGSCMRRC
jgi:hypothetical protein